MKDKKVFIIGNGFDLSLGWKTKYSDFAASVFWPFATSVDLDSSLANHLYHAKNTEKWLDIENELFKYAHSKRNNDLPSILTTNTDGDKKDFRLLKEKLFSYLKSQQSEQIKEDSPAAKVLSAVISNGFFNDFYSFNYTDLNSICRKLECSEISVNYVHGSIENNDIILGIDDHKEHEVISDYDFLYKTFDKNYPSVPIKFALQDANEVVFFGHSLGNVDYHYFQDFFKTQSSLNLRQEDSVIITIFTFNDESRIDILRQIRKMNGQNTLSSLYQNNCFRIICTDGKDPKDAEWMADFFSRLDSENIINSIILD